MLHAVAIVLAVTIPWQAPRRERADYIVLQPTEEPGAIAPFAGTRGPRTPRPAVLTTARRLPEPPPPPTPPPDTGGALLVYNPGATLVPAPQIGDGRLWVSPRPALPGPVAEAIYGDTVARDSAAIGRLRSMVDSLNIVLDQVQRDRQRPSWTVGGEGGTPKFGIDSQYIHVAGVKIPTAALALLGNLLPQGNYDEGLRARQLSDMRADLLRAADRAQTFRDFRRYVRELRERNQAERDAERRRQAQDTVRVVP
ncbi:MAG TPA: hypothetical protein VEK86_07345 [Gemmatimonadales bacterium]|nr:hypothetical protein [Gemmatimonadales bacterium]